MTIAWEDIEGEAGYQLWYSTEKKGKYTKISNCAKNTHRIYKSGFESGETYYFKVRAYKKTAEGYIYSAFSNIRAVTVK